MKYKFVLFGVLLSVASSAFATPPTTGSKF